MSAWKAISSSDPVACNNTNQKQVKCIAQWRTNDVLLRRKVCLIEILPMRLCEEKETKEMYYIAEFVKRMRSSSSRSANSAARLISLEALVQLLAHENGPTRRPCWRMCVYTRVCCERVSRRRNACPLLPPPSAAHRRFNSFDASFGQSSTVLEVEIGAGDCFGVGHVFLSNSADVKNRLRLHSWPSSDCLNLV